MDYLVVREEPQTVTPDAKQKPAVIAAVVHGKYYACGSTGTGCGHRRNEMDLYMAMFDDKVTPAQFRLIANSITKALVENTSAQIYKGCEPVLSYPPKIEIRPAKEGRPHEIVVSLSMSFESSYMNEGNNPKEFRHEFGKQVAEVFGRAMKGQLEYDEPKPRFLQARIAAARVARRFVK